LVLRSNEDGALPSRDAALAWPSAPSDVVSLQAQANDEGSAPVSPNALSDVPLPPPAFLYAALELVNALALSELA
jgi:hypothetical protein